MKKLMIIFSAIFAFAACSKDDYKFDYPTDKFDFYSQCRYFAQFIESGLPKKLPVDWYREEIHHEGGSSLGSNQFCIYFIDEEGNSLLDVNDLSTWPVPMCFQAAQDDPDNFYANMTTVNERRMAYVAGGNANELPIFHMMIPSDGKHTTSFKLRLLGKEYDMKITYLYKYGAAGHCCYNYVFRWDINGELLYSDFESRYDFNGLGISSRAVVTIKKDGTLSIERIWEKK